MTFGPVRVTAFALPAAQKISNQSTGKMRHPALHWQKDEGQDHLQAVVRKA
jgi:hypothetical protein